MNPVTVYYLEPCVTHAASASATSTCLDPCCASILTHKNHLDNDDNLTQFDRICRARLATGVQAFSTWEAEFHAYLKEVEANVSLPDINVIKWWQVCTYSHFHLFYY